MKKEVSPPLQRWADAHGTVQTVAERGDEHTTGWGQMQRAVRKTEARPPAQRSCAASSGQLSAEDARTERP